MQGGACRKKGGGLPKKDLFERTVTALYDAALDDARVADAAGLVNEAIGTRGHAIGYGGSNLTGAPDVLSARLYFGAERREDWERLYFRRYWPWDESVARLHDLPDGRVVPIRDLYTKSERKTSPAYCEFRRTIGARNGVSVLLKTPEECRIVWSLADSVEGGGWAASQIRTIERLLPHIRQFVRVRRALADTVALDASFRALLENTRTGVIGLDRRGRISEANDRARNLLRERGGLTDRGRILFAEIAAEDARLQGLLARALPPYDERGSGGSMTVTRPSAATPLILDVHPVRMNDTDDYRAGRVAALVIVVDPASQARIDPRLAETVLGLSPAESRVAVAVAAGLGVPEIARATDRTEATVRWHIKRIFRRLGITKQTELVRRILSLEILRGGSRID